MPAGYGSCRSNLWAPWRHPALLGKDAEAIHRSGEAPRRCHPLRRPNVAAPFPSRSGEGPSPLPFLRRPNVAAPFPSRSGEDPSPSSILLPTHAQPFPSLLTQFPQCLDVLLVDPFRFRISVQSTTHTFLPQQVQRRMRRTVGIMTHVIERFAGKPVIRMKPGQLDDPLQFQLRQPGLGRIQE